MGGPGGDPPPRKIDTFFLGSLALSVPIYRYFQSIVEPTGEVATSKHFTKKLFNALLYEKNDFDV